MRIKTIKAAHIEAMMDAAIGIMDDQGIFYADALAEKLEDMRSNHYKNTLEFLQRKHVFNKAGPQSFAINPLALIAWDEKRASETEQKKALGWMKDVLSDVAVDGTLWIPIDGSGATRGGKSSPLAGFKLLEKNKRNADGTPYLRYTLKRSGGRARGNGLRAAIDVVVPKTIATKTMREWEKAEILINPTTRQIALKRGDALRGYSIRWDGSPHYAQVSIYSGTAQEAAADLSIELKETTERTPLALVEQGTDFIIFELT